MKIVLTEEFFDLTYKFDKDFTKQIFITLRELSSYKNTGLDIEKMKGLKNTWKAKINDQYRIIYTVADGTIFASDIWDHQTENYRSEAHLAACPKEAPRFKKQGILTSYFDLLEKAGMIEELSEEEKYHENLFHEFSPLLSNFKNDLLSEMKKINLKIFPHIAHRRHINRDPIIWLVFTNSDDPCYQNYPQIGFHVAIGNGTRSTFKSGDTERHVSIKIAEFGTRAGYRQFFENFYTDREKFFKRYFYKRCIRLKPNFFLYFRKNKTDFKTYELNELKQEDDLINFFGDTETLAEKSDFFALEISRKYFREDLRKFENYEYALAEIASNMAELAPLYFLFTEPNVEKRWSEYREFLEKYRESEIYKRSSFS